MGDRVIEYMRVRDLVPAPRNPNDHQGEQIAASIGRHGYVEPIVLDERTVRMVAGHGRREDLLAREAAGEAPPDGVRLDADGAYLAPVVRGWSSPSDGEAEAYLMASNLEARNRPDTLAELLADLAMTEGGLAGTGYTDDTLDDLLASLGDEHVLDPQPTDAAHAEQTERGEPATPREVQGLHEVGLMFQTEHHREYLQLLATLKHQWSEDVAPLVVLRAMRAAVALPERPPPPTAG